MSGNGATLRRPAIQELATRAPVKRAFPARFTLHLYSAPGAARGPWFQAK